MIQSKSRESANAISRKADYLEIDQSTLPVGLVGSVQKVGSPSVDQLKAGVEYPTVQAAISDLTNMYQMPIGSVLTFSEASDQPTSVNMQEILEFSGTVSYNDVQVYGIPLNVTVGQNAAAVTTAAFEKLNLYATNDIAIKSVVKVDGSTTKLRVTFRDTNPHDNYNFNKSGIVITGTTEVPAASGYGTWTKIGTSAITPTGGNPNTIHHYKRVS